MKMRYYCMLCLLACTLTARAAEPFVECEFDLVDESALEVELPDSWFGQFSKKMGLVFIVAGVKFKNLFN